MHAVPQLSSVADFLSRHPPFAGLPDAELERIAQSAPARAYAEGATVLVEDGTPADVLT